MLVVLHPLEFERRIAVCAAVFSYHFCAVIVVSGARGGGEMVLFEYEFKKKSTGRRNKRTRYARGQEGLRRALLHDPDVGEILSVSIARMPAASQAQLDYLRDLTGDAPSGLSMLEASDLITNALERRVPAEEQDRILAERFGAPFTRFSNKKALFERITRSNLDDLNLAIWFVYRVYRDAFDRGSRSGIDNPDDSRLTSIASALAANPQAIASLRGMREHTLTGFRWFGDLQVEAGELIAGDDASSMAYEYAASLLEAVHLIDRKKRSQLKMPSSSVARTQSIGIEKGQSRIGRWFFVFFLLISFVFLVQSIQ